MTAELPLSLVNFGKAQSVLAFVLFLSKNVLYLHFQCFCGYLLSVDHLGLHGVHYNVQKHGILNQYNIKLSMT